MPIYEYECPDCKHIMEEIRTTWGRDDLAVCPVCGGTMERKVSVSNFTIDPWIGT
jgi:putative FmdB family regulatory protein